MGDSQRKYIGYGWIEKADVRKWIKKDLAKEGQQQKVVIFGVSMGAATAMMASGEKLPRQVKAIVEDCGYTNVKAEMEHEAKALYHLPVIPRFPLVDLLSGINRLRVGYFLGDASSTYQLASNHRPILFIHGTNDHFVPTWMVYQNYRADHGPKRLWLVPGAKHARSFATHPVLYQKHLRHFLQHYVS